MGLWVFSSGPDDRHAAYALARGIVTREWSGTGDLTGVAGHAEVAARLSAAYPAAPPDAIRGAAERLYEFVALVAPGDLVVSQLRLAPDVLVGRVVGPYVFDPSAPVEHRHRHATQWLGPVPLAQLDPELRAALAPPARRDAPAPVASRPKHTVSRRAFVLTGVGAVLGASGAAALILHPWRSSRAASAARDAPAVPASTTTTTAAAVAQTAAGPVARWVVDENAKPGSADWNLTNGAEKHEIEGFADAVSATQGQTVTLYVSTVAPSFRVDAFRMGWYQGLGARLIWTSAETPGVHQPPSTLTPKLYTDEAHWQPSLKVPVDATFPPGVYLLRLTASTGKQRMIPLVVRDDASTAAYVVQCSVTTWQAYNEWGGHSLYNGPRVNYNTRARVVSFDRPYDSGDGQSDFLGNDYPFIKMLEQMGLDVTYITNVDTHAHPELLLRHKAFFSLGHDEYWSKAMRDGVEAARDAGVNLGFLGANACYRQIRFEDSPLGPNRHMVCYKSADEDPIRATNRELITANWRAAPVSRPESSMIGQQYESHPVSVDMVLVDPTAWVFAGMNIAAGQRIQIGVGNEYDRYDPNQKGPNNVQILAHSPLTINGVRSFSNMTYYSAPSGAGVWSTGSIYWISKLTPPGDRSPFDALAVQITKNVLAGFGYEPAGRQHPSVANYHDIAARYGAASGRVTGT